VREEMAKSAPEAGEAPEAEAEPDMPEIISEAQRRALFAKADNATVHEVIFEFGYESTKTIQKKDFDAILKRLADIKLAADDETGEATMNAHMKETLPEADDEPFDDSLPWETGNDWSA
ncbi:MAG: hypothetical protein FWD23_15405, partial [Oscillospiraceae bacterium]|nr:hypothetical protein [Oscillospiraceae bacterium]